MTGQGDRPAGRLIVMSTGAYRAALDEILHDFEQSGGFAARAVYAAAAAIAARIAAGEGFDVAITTSASMAGLADAGFVVPSSRRLAGCNAVCLAYRQGAPAPRAVTPEELRKTLLQATSISVSDPVHGGGSSSYFFGILDSLGLEAAIAPRLVFTPGGQGARPVAEGSAEIGIAQTSEIAAIPGLAAVPLWPANPEGRADYEAAIGTRAALPQAAAALTEFLSGAMGAAIRARCGLGG
jgi:molybdate transport system substrate-binding protein